MEGEIMI